MDTNAIKRTLVRTALRLPEPIQRVLARGIPRHADRQELDAQTQMSLFLIEKDGGADLETLSPPEARAFYEEASTVFCGDKPPIGHVIDADASGVPVRLYTPAGVGASTPAIVYYHGGGAVIGNLETHDDCCRWIANRAKTMVISVDYRLAPEHKFPAGIDDAIAAYGWVCEQADALGIDPACIAVAGDSFGGYLALNVCMAARDGSVPMPKCQLLIYPVSDFTFDVPSFQMFGRHYLLTASMMQWFFAHYVEDVAMASDPAVSPYFSDLSGLPTTIIATAGFDPLRDDGRRLANKIEATGTRCIYRCHASLIHGFATQIELIDAATRAMGASVDLLRAELSPQSR